jgi:hypothetical protein
LSLVRSVNLSWSAILTLASPSYRGENWPIVSLEATEDAPA